MTHHHTLSPRDRRDRRDPRAERVPGEIFGTSFTLFADMLLVGLLTGLACLPVVTAPAAFAAASATLRETVEDGGPMSMGSYVTHLRARLTSRSLAGGLLVPLLAMFLVVDAALVRGSLPGAALVAPALVLLTLSATVVALRATALAEPHQLSLPEGLMRSITDLRGTLLLSAAVLLTVLLAWSMPLLIPLLPGPLAFAATAMDVRSTAVRPIP